jgi:transposase
MARAIGMVEAHMRGILAYWSRGLTTAFMEGLNGSLSAVKYEDRGYRTMKYMTATLYFTSGKLALSCYCPLKTITNLSSQ